MATLPLPIPLPMAPPGPVLIPTPAGDRTVIDQSIVEWLLRITPLGAALGFLLDERRRRAAGGTAGDRIRAAREAVQIATQAAQDQAARQLAPITFAQQVASSLENNYQAAVRAMQPPVDLPAFSSQDQLDAWMRELVNLGPTDRLALPAGYLPWAQGWYSAESARLHPVDWLAIARDMDLERGGLIPIPSGQAAAPQASGAFISGHLAAGGAIAAAAPPAPGIAVPGPGDVAGAIAGAAAAAAVLAGLGIQGGTLTATGEQLMQRIGRQRHRGTLDSQGTTIETILGLVKGVAGPAALSYAILGTDAGRVVAEQIGGRIFDLVLDPSVLPGPMTIDKVEEAAAKLFTRKLALGATAHLWAVTTEVFSPLKQLGLNQFAAQLADLAGFGRLASATIGEIERAGLGVPMKQVADRRYRTQIPPPPEALTLYAKKEIPPGPIPEGYPQRYAWTQSPAGAPDATLYELMARAGMPDWAIRSASTTAFHDPSLREILRLGEFFNPAILPETRDPPPFVRAWIAERPWLLEQIGVSLSTWTRDWWLYYKVSRGGHEPADIRVVVEAVKRISVAKESATAIAAAAGMHRDGFIGDVELRDLVQEAWGARPGPDGTYAFAGDAISARMRATQLHTQLTVLANTRDMVLMAYRKGTLTRQEASADLAALGMDPVRVRLDLARATLGLLAGVRLSVPADETAALDVTPAAPPG